MGVKWAGSSGPCCKPLRAVGSMQATPSCESCKRQADAVTQWPGWASGRAFPCPQSRASPDVTPLKAAWSPQERPQFSVQGGWTRPKEKKGDPAAHKRAMGRNAQRLAPHCLGSTGTIEVWCVGRCLRAKMSSSLLVPLYLSVALFPFPIASRCPRSNIGAEASQLAASRSHALKRTRNGATAAFGEKRCSSVASTVGRDSVKFLVAGIASSDSNLPRWAGACR